MPVFMHRRDATSGLEILLEPWLINCAVLHYLPAREEMQAWRVEFISALPVGFAMNDGLSWKLLR